MLRTLALAVALALAVLACGGPTGGPGSGAGTVTVQEKEWAIEPKTIEAKAGTATFRVKNTGNIEHNFEIPGVGKIDSILAGETKTLEVTLQPGTYDVICSLAGHREAGMVGKLVVGR